MKKQFLAMFMMLAFVAIASVSADARAVTETSVSTTIHAPEMIVQVEVIQIDRVSVFFPVEAQTDSTPLITASGAVIDEDKLAAGKLRWVALSRDLLSKYGGKFKFGDTIQLNTGDLSIDGQYIVQNVMNKRYKRAVDILRPTGSDLLLINSAWISV